ncbi:MAG: 50S ribosomal protein L6 [Firmicutes bacterium]|nr:50S ribosomal protein L6 [Bacillota bacterium]
MSRVGRAEIALPAGVTVGVENNTVTVKGPKGELSQYIDDRNIVIENNGAVLNVVRKSESKSTKAKHGLYRQLIANMVKGVVEPFSKTLIVKGVGYKVALAGNKITMNVGLSHTVEFVSPQDVTLACPDANTIVVSGISKQRVGQVAATLKSKKPVEPYHLYGIHYQGERLVKKEGKTSGK